MSDLCVPGTSKQAHKYVLARTRAFLRRGPKFKILAPAGYNSIETSSAQILGVQSYLHKQDQVIKTRMFEFKTLKDRVSSLLLGCMNLTQHENIWSSIFDIYLVFSFLKMGNGFASQVTIFILPHSKDIN